MSEDRDRWIIRDLAHRYAEAAAKPIQAERRDLWRRHNSLGRTRPLIYMRWLAAWHEAPESKLECEDPFWRHHENWLRQMLFQDTIGDDYILEPWIAQPVALVTPPQGLWGVEVRHKPSPLPGGSWMYDPPLKRPEDLDLLVVPEHLVNEESTRQYVGRLRDTVGDILPVVEDRAPAWRVWHADISTDLAHLRGLEQVMWDMHDNPEWLHRLLAFMRAGVLKAQGEAEAAGDWRLCDHENQAMPYAEELPDPSPSPEPVPRRSLWGFFAAQEMAQVSPAMHEEFMLRYQLPIMEHFGLVSYGCCEDLTQKIDMVRQIPNLRRIAITPWADVARCAERIGTDYVFSWRPSPAEMICRGFDRERVRRIVSEAMEASRGCIVDITLKDVQTVRHHPEDLREWVRIVRDVTDRYA